jgi:hypothetical protein|tara:strand:- start:4345 stop:4473 length:129 start_codon:yes stop_codon:yes gene_type:complete
MAVFAGGVSRQQHVQHSSSYGARLDMLGKKSARTKDMATAKG